MPSYCCSVCLCIRCTTEFHSDYLGVRFVTKIDLEGEEGVHVSDDSVVNLEVAEGQTVEEVNKLRFEGVLSQVNLFEMLH